MTAASYGPAMPFVRDSGVPPYLQIAAEIRASPIPMSRGNPFSCPEAGHHRPHHVMSQVIEDTPNLRHGSGFDRLRRGGDVGEAGVVPVDAAAAVRTRADHGLAAGRAAFTLKAGRPRGTARFQPVKLLFATQNSLPSGSCMTVQL
jgi:hypothetical protein